MDYKQLSLVCELMGLNLSYEFIYKMHCYQVQFENDPPECFMDSVEHNSIASANKWLKRTYPIQYTNALNQLNLK